MADDKSAARKRAKAAAQGKTKPSSIGAKARAAANALASKKNNEKPATESRKLEPKKKNSGLYEGKRRSGASADNRAGYEFGGKHSKGAATGKHAAPATRSSVQKNMNADNSTPSTGRHTVVSRMKAGMAERKSARAKVGRK
jgi:hypothetical protein